MDALEMISEQATQAPIVLFMKGTPERPMSSDSQEAIHVLDQYRTEFAFIDVQQEPNIRAFLPKFSASAECPQLFMQGELIGGIAVIRELHQQGELGAMIDQCQSPLALVAAAS